MKRDQEVATIAAAIAAERGHSIYKENTLIPKKKKLRFVGDAVSVENDADSTVVSINGGEGSIIWRNFSTLIPNLLSAKTNSAGDQIILYFDKNLTEVSGKQSQFNVEISIYDTYQKWKNYPDSPCLTSDLPYQCIAVEYWSHSNICLIAGNTPIQKVDAYYYPFTPNTIYPSLCNQDTGVNHIYTLQQNGQWSTSFGSGWLNVDHMLESNQDIFDCGGNDPIPSNNGLLYFEHTASLITTTSPDVVSVAFGADNQHVILTLGTPIVHGGTVKLSYAQGDITSQLGGKLKNIADYEVKNEVM